MPFAPRSVLAPSTPPRAHARAREKVLVDSFASNYKCLTGSYKKLVITILIKCLLLLLLRHLLLVAMAGAPSSVSPPVSPSPRCPDVQDRLDSNLLGTCHAHLSLAQGTLEILAALGTSRHPRARHDQPINIIKPITMPPVPMEPIFWCQGAGSELLGGNAPRAWTISVKKTKRFLKSSSSHLFQSQGGSTRLEAIAIRLKTNSSLGGWRENGLKARRSAIEA